MTSAAAAADEPTASAPADPHRVDTATRPSGTRRRPPKLRRRALAIGTPLLVAAVLTASAPGTIRIRPGDTLWGIAQSHHTTVAALQALNGLRGDRIYAGKLLKIPGNNPTPKRAQYSTSHYKVKAGDTVYGIARRYGVSPASIAALNHLDGRSTIYIGASLSIPVTRASRGVPRTGGPVVSKSTVESIVDSTARRLGVDPALAKAVACQESGFQQQVVSPAHAIGTMQILPSTGAWLSSVSGRKLDLTDVHDNVYAGVYFLRMLIRDAGVTNGIAGYYQGLFSVQKKGQFSDTKAYVRSVKALRVRFS